MGRLGGGGGVEGSVTVSGWMSSMDASVLRGVSLVAVEAGLPSSVEVWGLRVGETAGEEASGALFWDLGGEAWK